MKTILLLALLLPTLALGQREVSGDFFPGIKVEKNYLANPYFEKNLTATLGTTHSTTRNTSSPIQGVADLQIVAGAAGNTRITTLAWEKRLEGQNCELSFKYTGGGGTWSAQIWDGSLNVLVSRALPASTLVSPIQINYPCGSSSGRTIRFVTTASASNLNVDELYYGLATNIITLDVVTDWVPYTPIYEGFGTVAVSNMSWRRVGSNLEIKGNFTAGTVTAAEARIYFPAGLTSLVTNQGRIVTGKSIRGSTTTNHGSILFYNSNTSQNYFTFSDSGTLGTASINPQNNAAGNAVTVTGEVSALHASATIAGWSSTQQAVTQQCIQDGSCENVFSAFVDSSGVVTGENINWISGNAAVTDTSLFTMTLAISNTAGMNCVPTVSIVGFDAGNLTARIEGNPNGTTVAVRTGFTSSGSTNFTKNPYNFRIVCQRQAADYKPRFAAPVLTGSVTSNSPLALRTETTHYVCSGSSSLSEPSTPGVYTSIGNISSGVCTVNIASGVFSAAPYHCEQSMYGAPANTFPKLNVKPTATSVQITCYTGGGVGCASFSGSLKCMGPR